MADNNKEIIKSGVYEDNDPTAELDALPEPVSGEIEADRGVEADSDDNIFDFAEHDTKFGDADKAVVSFESGFRSCAETIEVLQFQPEEPQQESTEFQKEVKVLEAMINRITEELKLAYEEQFHTSELLKKRDKEIESLRSKMTDKEQTLKELAQQIAAAKNKEQELESEAESADVKPTFINHYQQDVEELRTTSSTDTPRGEAKEESQELALLVPVNGNGSSEHPIRKGRQSLGSSPDNDIRIKSKFTSRHHAQIISSSTNSILRDLNSTNGTYVNSKRIKRHALRNGDSITIGKNRFKYVAQKLGSSDYRKTALKQHP
jgi:peptidoglycan hydrolase CwlO-like protein